MSRYELPDEVTLALDEVRPILLALYDARDALKPQPSGADSQLSANIDAAIRILSSKLVPDFPD